MQSALFELASATAWFPTRSSATPGQVLRLVQRQTFGRRTRARGWLWTLSGGRAADCELRLLDHELANFVRLLLLCGLSFVQGNYKRGEQRAHQNRKGQRREVEKKHFCARFSKGKGLARVKGLESPSSSSCGARVRTVLPRHSAPCLSEKDRFQVQCIHLLHQTIAIKWLFYVPQNTRNAYNRIWFFKNFPGVHAPGPP